jgi:hypothetical protein
MPGDRSGGERLDKVTDCLGGPLADLAKPQAAASTIGSAKLDYSATVTLLCDACHD